MAGPGGGKAWESGKKLPKGRSAMEWRRRSSRNCVRIAGFLGGWVDLKGT